MSAKFPVKCFSARISLSSATSNCSNRNVSFGKSCLCAKNHEYNVGDILPVIIIYKDNTEVKRIIGEKSEKEIFSEIEDVL